MRDRRDARQGELLLERSRSHVWINLPTAARKELHELLRALLIAVLRRELEIMRNE